MAEPVSRSESGRPPPVKSGTFLLDGSNTANSLNADCTACDTLPIFLSSEYELANMTTKKANSKVMKSAYEISQRS